MKIYAWGKLQNSTLLAFVEHYLNQRVWETLYISHISLLAYKNLNHLARACCWNTVIRQRANSMWGASFVLFIHRKQNRAKNIFTTVHAASHIIVTFDALILLWYRYNCLYLYVTFYFITFAHRYWFRYTHTHTYIYIYNISLWRVSRFALYFNE